MSDGNGARIDRGREALLAYVGITGDSYAITHDQLEQRTADQGEMEGATIDLVADVLHFASANDIDPAFVVERAHPPLLHRRGGCALMRIEVIHGRDPDEGCEVTVFIDGERVVAEVYNVDPGRGHSRADWDDTTEFLCRQASPKVAEILRAERDEAADNSQYVEG